MAKASVLRGCYYLSDKWPEAECLSAFPRKIALRLESRGGLDSVLPMGVSRALWGVEECLLDPGDVPVPIRVSVIGNIRSIRYRHRYQG